MASVIPASSAFRPRSEGVSALPLKHVARLTPKEVYALEN